MPGLEAYGSWEGRGVLGEGANILESESEDELFSEKRAEAPGARLDPGPDISSEASRSREGRDAGEGGALVSESDRDIVSSATGGRELLDLVGRIYGMVPP